MIFSHVICSIFHLLMQKEKPIKEKETQSKNGKHIKKKKTNKQYLVFFILLPFIAPFTFRFP